MVFTYLDLSKLAIEYEYIVPPRTIRLILQHVKLTDLDQARQALDLYSTDSAVKQKIDSFIQEKQKSLEGKLF